MLRVEINNHSLFHRMYSASIKVSFQKKQFISQIANRDTVKSFNKQKSPMTGIAFQRKTISSKFTKK